MTFRDSKFRVHSLTQTVAYGCRGFWNIRDADFAYGCRGFWNIREADLRIDVEVFGTYVMQKS